MTSIIKLTVLSGAYDEGPLCYLLQVDEFRFLLDCGWNEAFSPEVIEPVKKHIHQIDAVLLTFPDIYHMGALPYLVGKCGLHCPIYTTIPVYKMGQMFMYDLFQIAIRGETVGGVAECRLFLQASKVLDLNCYQVFQQALSQADLIFLFGARLNWILHFGKPPRFKADVKIVQIDLHAEEMGNNIPAEVTLLGDVKSVTEQLNSTVMRAYGKTPSNLCGTASWRKELLEKSEANKKRNEELANDSTVPMNYYQVYGQLKKHLPHDCIIVNEGANTMDIGRTMMPNQLPRKRLDAGTFGTVGVGIGFAIAAALLAESQTDASRTPRRVVCVQGDSAFGFSGMELETACRYNLPIVFVIVNNNGIYSGVDEKSWSECEVDPARGAPPTALKPNTHYERIIEAFGGKGYFAETPEELNTALTFAFEETKKVKKPVLINVMISPYADRKPQEFFWLTRSKM